MAPPQQNGCAVRMADGRLFTDYRPRCDIQLQFQSPMSGSYDYRQWLIANGTRIAEHQRAAARKASCCAPCKLPLAVGTMLPESDRVVCDKVGCTRVPMPGAKGGLSLGTGREYGTLPAVREADTKVLQSWASGCS
jgi:hypothetical protein